ncbi:MAG TPA: sigma-70 family RNA polymerase sigma factor [Polyangiaceae bacterium]|nr:sigma-70 family RNA polymerase sigma factor [Polyangiaceae bacterium]
MPLSVLTGPGTPKPRVAEPALGDRPDFEAVYEGYFDFVWRSLRRLGVPEAQLDDATQDVFLVVYRRLDEFEARSSLKTWLFGIVLRVTSTLRRTARRKPTEPLAEEPVARGSAPEALTESREAARLVQSLLDELDDDRRAVFVLAELEQMTAPEISTALSVNLNTVYSRLRAARRDFDAALARRRRRSPE